MSIIATAIIIVYGGIINMNNMTPEQLQEAGKIFMEIANVIKKNMDTVKNKKHYQELVNGSVPFADRGLIQQQTDVYSFIEAAAKLGMSSVIVKSAYLNKDILSSLNDNGFILYYYGDGEEWHISWEEKNNYYELLRVEAGFAFDRFHSSENINDLISYFMYEKRMGRLFTVIHKSYFTDEIWNTLEQLGYRLGFVKDTDLVRVDYYE